MILLIHCDCVPTPTPLLRRRKGPYYGSDVTDSNVKQKKSKSRKSSGSTVRIRPRSKWTGSSSSKKKKPQTKESRKFKDRTKCCEDKDPQEQAGDGGHFTFYENQGGGAKSHSFFWVPGAEKTPTSAPSTWRRTAALKSDSRPVFNILPNVETKTKPESFLQRFEKFRNESRSIAISTVRYIVDEVWR